MLITLQMKLADVIHHDHNLIPVINRFGIRLGFGDKSIGEICAEKSVNPDFFITILNAFHDSQFFPKRHLQSFPASLLVDYLRKTHRDFLEVNLPEIESLIFRMSGGNDKGEEAFLLAQNFFMEYKNELKVHIEREEDRVYPYALALEEALAGGEVTPEVIHRMENYSITDYEAEHEDVEEKLFDLKNIIIKYLPEPADDQLSFQILSGLFALEKDLNEHARIENMILIPKVEAMEFTIKNRINRS